MRTPDEIVAHYRAIAADDFLGFAADVLLSYLTFDQARPLLRDDATADLWGEVLPLDRDGVIAAMRSYMAFAWGKVTGHRGISASRSVAKMGAWLWLLGDDALAAQVADPANYPQYGAPALKLVCDAYGFPVPDSPGLANMIAGLPCYPGCEEGCGG